MRAKEHGWHGRGECGGWAIAHAGRLLILFSMLGFVPESRSAEPAPRSRLASWLTLRKGPTQAPEAGRKSTSTVQGVVRPLSAPRSKGTDATRSIQPVVSIVKVSGSSELVPISASEDGSKPNVIPEPAPNNSVEIKSAEINSAMSLESLTALADANHPRLTAAFQRIQAAQGRTVQAGLYPNPKVAASSPQISGNESQYNGFASQEFVTAGKLKLSVAAAQQEVAQARFAWQQERFLVLTDLRQKFYATLAAQRRVAVLKTLVQIAGRSRESAQKLLKAGEGSRGDSLLFDIELKRAEVALKNAQTIYDVGRRQLAILVAVPDLAIETLSGDMEAKTRNYTLDEVQFAAASVNPQASIARLEIDRNAYLLQRARVEPIPNLDVMGGYQRQVGPVALNQGVFQVTMSIPLWNKNQGNISAIQADMAGARANLQRVELQLENLAADAFTTFATAGQLVEQYEIEILPKARETLELSQTLYVQGQIDFLRLLQSQKTLLDAELAWIAAQEQRWIAAAALAGLLQEESFP